MIPFSAAAVALAWVLLQQASLLGPGLLAGLAPVLLVGGWAVFGMRGCLVAGSGIWVCLTSHALLVERLPAGMVGQDIVIQVRVCDFPRTSTGAVRFLVDTGAGAGFPGVPRRLQVGWYADAPAPALGEDWQLKLRLRGARGLRNEAGFDFERWLFTGRIGGTAYVRPSALNQRLPPAADSRRCGLASWRGRVAASLEDALDGHGATGYLLGLVVGSRHRFEERDWELLRNTGTSHLMAISGLHVGLVAGFAGLLGGGLARLLPGRARGSGRRTLGLGAGLLTGTLYAALAGFAIPTQRALVMLWTVGLLLACRRRPDPPECLAAAGLAVLLIDPLAPLQAGFWLSFVGVAVCLAAARWAGPAPAAETMWQVAVRWLRTLLRLQLLLAVGMAPLTLLFFGQVPLLSVPANLVAVPAFSLFLVPLVLAGTALLGIWPAAGAALLLLAGDALLWLLGFLAWLADMPGGVLDASFSVPPASGLALLAVLLLLWPPPLPARLLAIPVLLAAALARPEPPPVGGFRIQVLDVGQGLAVLVRTHGHTLLYDAGPAFAASDAGRSVVVPVLRKAGIHRLDVLLISHGDLDHRGGAASVLASHPEAELIAPERYDLPAKHFTRCRAGNRWRWDAVEFLLLHPDEIRIPWSRNDASCVLLIRSAAAAALLPGDIERLAEGYLLREGRIGAVDLVIVPHHGSRTSSTPALVDATQPDRVVISAGAFNRFGHPDPAVVRRWTEAGACVLNTALDGAIELNTTAGQGLRLSYRARVDGRRLWTSREPPPAACAKREPRPSGAAGPML